MKSSYKFYKACYRIGRVLLGVVYSFCLQGKGGIPEGAALICANHSSIIDPIFLAFAFGINCHIHVIAKAELYKVPVLSAVIRKLGTIRVDRSINDVNSVRETLNYLKKGAKVAIFPEGTRKSVENAVQAKSGAIKVAELAKVPIIPVYIPRKKPLFSKIHIVIGEPYFIEKRSEKRTSDEYLRLAENLMNKIESLSPGKNKNSEFGIRNSG